MQSKYTVYLKHRAIKKTGGIFDHWFFEIPSEMMEIHPGNYNPGTHLPLGTTKNAHTYIEAELCNTCKHALIADTLDLYSIFFYPFINCESISGMFFDCVPISVQTVLTLCVLITCALALINICFLYLCLVFVIIYLLYSKYLYSKSYHFTCCHLEVV